VNTFGSLLQMKVLKKPLHELLVKVNLDELRQGSWYVKRGMLISIVWQGEYRGGLSLHLR